MNRTVDLHPFSVPRYPTGQPAQRAAVHVLVTQDDGQQAVTQWRAANREARLHHLALPHYPCEAELLQALVELLGEARVGVHLQLQGDEAFIWTLNPVARDAGLEAEEIDLQCSNANRRLLFCVHCATRQAGTAAELHTCERCGVELEVRRHFSERLGAYIGVCADADHPYAQARP